MLPKQELIDHLAGRIQRAYSLRGKTWFEGRSTTRVWEAAAQTLWVTAWEHDEIPLDPELYVASQPVKSKFADPWMCLAHPIAAKRYRRRVRRIIRQLRSELRREVLKAESLVQLGHGLNQMIEPRNSRFSALGLYITAHRLGCLDLANDLRNEAIEQHKCCPLYRTASRSLLPARAYPYSDETPGLDRQMNKPSLASPVTQN